MACEHSRRVLAAATIAFLLNAAGADAEQSISPLAAMSTAAQTTDPTDWGKFADQYLEAYFERIPASPSMRAGTSSMVRSRTGARRVYGARSHVGSSSV